MKTLGIRPAYLLLFVSFTLLLAVMDRAPLHLEPPSPQQSLQQNFTSYFLGVVAHTAPGPYAYRFLVPLTIDGLHRLAPAASPMLIDLAMKAALLLLCHILLFRYLSLFFAPAEALLGVTLQAVCLGFCLSSVQGPTIIETIDLFNLAVFISAFLALAEGLVGTLCLLAFLGTLNRETTLFLVPIALLLVEARGKHLLRAIAVSLATIVPFLLVRALIHPPDPAWFTTDSIGRNIPFLSASQTPNALAAIAHALAFLGPLFLLAAVNFSAQPPLLRRIAYVTPLFVLVHVLVGDLIESRMWMPLLPMLIPLALRTLTDLHVSPEAGTSPPARPNP